MANLVIKLCILMLILASCQGSSELKTINQYQAAIIGKEYKYIPKPKKGLKKTQLSSLSFTRHQVKTHFEEDSDNGFSIDYSSSRIDGNSYISVNPYYYSGTYKVKHYNDSIYDLNGNFNYYGFGIRMEYVYGMGDEFFSFRPLNIQFNLSYELGDYIKWREKAERSDSDFKNLGESKINFSYYIVPELIIHASEKISVGLNFGLGRAYNGGESQYISHLFGASIQYGKLTFFFSQNRTEFEHKIDTFKDDGILVRKDDVLESKTAEYSQIGISYSF